MTVRGARNQRTRGLHESIFVHVEPAEVGGCVPRVIRFVSEPHNERDRRLSGAVLSERANSERALTDAGRGLTWSSQRTPTKTHFQEGEHIRVRLGHNGRERGMPLEGPQESHSGHDDGAEQTDVGAENHLQQRQV